MKGIKAILLILFLLFILITPAMASQNLASKKIQENDPWNIGGGYYIMIEGLDIEGEQALISIRKSGEVLKDDLIQSGEKFEYRDSSETLIVSMKLDSIFKGMTTGTCQFTNIYLRFSESSTSPTPSPTKTATSMQTDSAQNTQDIKLEDNVFVTGPSAPMVWAILMSLIIIIRRKRKKL